ncbi:DUF3168 domain-containing protein [Pleomorphomonas koreensis]|uniref:DUF3168 domain-containing protein n=1 Tax=Pleomorphomonas koreensis TaxID=257440 RepID=UPI00041CE6F6|nr:DUF3168 domain-containing protein [Pleomorphomonas koreensis]
MSDPAGLALQGAIAAAVKGSPQAAAIQGMRIYDAVPDSVDFPYTAIGTIQEIDDGAGCMEEACEVYVTLHVWSRAVGKVECQRLVAAVVAALEGAELDLGAAWSLVELQVRSSEVFADVDGKTSHGVITLRALIDPAS